MWLYLTQVQLISFVYNTEKVENLNLFKSQNQILYSILFTYKLCNKQNKLDGIYVYLMLILTMQQF